MGGVRTALYNYLFAKKHNGDFILRVEDTDQARYVEGAEEYIVEALKWCNILPNEGQGFGGEYGPYRQSERKEQNIYRKYVDQLIEAGHAYYAFDTPEELEQMRENLKSAGVAAPKYDHISRANMTNSLSISAEDLQRRLNTGEPYVVRVKMPRNGEIRFKDVIRGWVVVQTSSLDDKVLFKSDGMPTYHLANIVDDHLMKISHVIRGEEWLPSAPLHVLLYQMFGWEDSMPDFAHLPLILRPDGNGKLSKRDGDRLGFPVFPLDWKDPESGEQSMGYRERGYFPQAFNNLLAMLGWNPGTTQEIFSMEELIEAFSLEKVGKAGAKFDPVKAKWYNQQYLRAENSENLAQMILPYLKESAYEMKNMDFLRGVCELMKERATFIHEIITEGDFFFEAPKEFDSKTLNKKWKETSPEIMSEWKESMKQINPFVSENIEEGFKKFLDEKSMGIGQVLPLYRLLLTGKGMGPSMFAISELLGKEESINRIDNSLDKIAAL